MYKYNLLFKKGDNTFVVSSKPTGWLKTEEFALLLREGRDNNGTFVKSWRTPVRKGR